MTEQVKRWPGESLKSFWGKWYFPANATLYVVGDLDRDMEATRELIEKTFGKLPAATEPAAASETAATATSAEPAMVQPDSSSNGSSGHAAAVVKQRHAVRPPVVHR